MPVIIYEPKGKAREYSPRALNIYPRACLSKCAYCYVPKMSFNSAYFVQEPQPREGLLEGIKKQLLKENIQDQVLISFLGDSYGNQELKHGMARKVLEVLLAHKIPVAILTKGGTNCLKDLDIFKAFDGHIKVGASLTFIEEKDSLEWEPGASLPANRFEALRELHRQGIKTWGSLEPVLDPTQTLRIIEETHEYVNHYKVGKINHFPEIEKAHDWDLFLKQAVDLLRSLGKPFYVKDSLRKLNRSTVLKEIEIDQDFLCVT